MIVSKVYRKVDLLETYPASDNEESGLDSTWIRSTASILMTSPKDQATSSTKPKHKHFHENGGNFPMVVPGFRGLSGDEKESPKQKWLIHR